MNERHETPGERMDKLERTIIWLAGLLSTDGVVQGGKSKNHQRFCFFAVYSVEKPWLQIIQERLAEIQIRSTIHFKDRKHRRIQIHNPRYVRELFLRFDCGKFFNPRKWKRITESYQFVSKRLFNPEEIEFIEKNVGTTDQEMAKILNRTKGAVYGYRWRNGIKKR